MNTQSASVGRPLSTLSIPTRTSNSLSLWTTLIWKEWNEHKWNTALVTSFAVGGVLLSGGQLSDIGIAVLITTAGALFLAMNVVAGERTDGSQAFVSSLPIQTWKLGVVRMSMAGILCIVPLLVSALAVQFVVPLYATQVPNGQLWTATLLSAGFCLSSFYWITAATAGQSTPLRVGLVGTIVLLSWFAVEFALGNLRHRHGTTVLEQLAWLGPIGWLMHGSTIPPKLPGMGWFFVGVTVIGVLFVVSVASYGLPLPQEKYSTSFNKTTRLGQSRRSPNASMFWLQVREALPLCGMGAGMCVTLGFVVAILFGNDHQVSIAKVAKLVETLALVMGIPWSVVIAVGTFAPNLNGGLHTFWRSQPIKVNDWYWSKFWLGAAVALLSIHLPVVILVGITQKLAWGDPTASCISYLLCPLAHLMTYSLGVLAATSVRRVPQAGALATAVATFFLALPMMPASPFSFLRYDRARIGMTEFILSAIHFPTMDAAALTRSAPFLLCTAVLTCVSALLGAIVVRRDLCVYRD